MATIIDLGQKVKTKYPGAYDDLDNAELGMRIKEKYPGSYSDFEEVPPVKSPIVTTQALGTKETKPTDFSVVETLKNIPRSGVEFVGGIAKAVTSPVETAKALGSVALGAAEKLVPGRQEAEKSFDALATLFKQRYGSVESLKKTVQEDPVGFLADVSTLAGGAGAVVSKAGQIAKLPAVAKAGAEALRVGKAVEPISAITKVAKPVVVPVVRGVAKKLEPFAERLVSSSLKLTPTAVRKIQKANVAGKPPEKWLLERGISGSPEVIVEKLDSIRSSSKEALDTGLAGISDKFRFTRVNEALGVLKSTFEGTPGNEDILSRLNQFRARKVYTLSEMNEVKWIIDKELNIFARSGEIKSGAVARGLRNIRGDIQGFIENNAAKSGFKEVKALNKETQVAKEIGDAINATEARRGANRVLSLTDLITGVVTGAVIDPLIAAEVVVAKKIMESPSFKTNIAKQIRNLSADDFYSVVKVVEGDDIPTPRFNMIMRKVMNAAKEETVRVSAFQAGRAQEVVNQE